LTEEELKINEELENDPLVRKLIEQLIGSRPSDFSGFVKNGRVNWLAIIHSLEWLQFIPDGKLEFFEIALQSAGICLSCDDEDRARNEGFLPLVFPKNTPIDSNELSFLRSDFPVVFAKIEDAKNYLKLWIERNYSPGRGYVPKKIGLRKVKPGDDLLFFILSSQNDEDINIEWLDFELLKSFEEGYNWGAPEEQIVINEWII
jgi:hypothetical protein